MCAYCPAFILGNVWMRSLTCQPFKEKNLVSLSKACDGAKNQLEAALFPIGAFFFFSFFSSSLPFNQNLWGPLPHCYQFLIKHPGKQRPLQRSTAPNYIARQVGSIMSLKSSYFRGFDDITIEHKTKETVLSPLWNVSFYFYFHVGAFFSPVDLHF